MARILSPFEHLEKRSKELLDKFIEPIIKAEEEALVNGDPIPDPDFDNLAAFRLLTHAELEGYFEKKALQAIERMDNDFKLDKVLTRDIAILTFVFWSTKKLPIPAPEGRTREDLKQNAQEALGFGRKFVADNNGIKENSILVLSAIMGFFADELDNLLVSELNQYGKLRGDVAHDSWMHNTRTFDSADLEKKRLENIVKLIKSFYEK